MTTYTKEAPASTEAEEGVLSCLLFNPRLVARVADTLKPEYFLDDRSAHIYEAILDLYQRGKACTMPNVRDELARLGYAEERYGWNLEELYNSLATLNPIGDYADSIIRTHGFREGLSLAQSFADDCYNQREGTFERAEQQLAKIILGTESKPVTPLSQAVDRYMQAYTKRREDFKQGITPGIPTHFRDLDKLLGGLLPSRLYTLAARPSIGKTALALNITLNIIQHMKHVIFFSAEMDEDELVQRMFSMETHIDQSFLRDGDTDDAQHEDMKAIAQRLSELDMKLDDRSYLLSHIRTKSMQVHRKKPLDLIVVDYLQLLEASVEGRSRNEARNEEVSKLSKGLKKLSRELKVPVLALAQLNRKSEESDLPQLSHLGESSSIEKDSDVVMFIHCDSTELEKRDRNEPYRLNIIVRKHRNGRIGQVPLMFRPRLTKFETIAYETPAE
jgi:replicative DNA helicase